MFPGQLCYNGGMSEEFSSLGQIFQAAKKKAVKPPAHEWQDLALRVIKELSIPAFKCNSVFRITKQLSKTLVERALNDTKELCQTGEKWKYFFKIVDRELPKASTPRPTSRRQRDTRKTAA